MELGICVRDIPARELMELGRFAEDHGYGEIFVPDGATGGMRTPEGLLGGRDAFCGLAAMFASTSSVRGAVGVAAAPMHLPMPLSMVASTLTEMSGGRFSLGIGVSHPAQTARHGVEYPARQVEFMAGWLDRLRAASTSGVAFGGWPVLLAALGPKMVELGATRADGLVLNWLTPEHAATTIAHARASVPPGAPTPRTVLYLRFMPADAVRRDAATYDAMPNYHRHLVSQGVEGVDQIVARTTLPFEDVGAARDRIEAYRDAGLDVLCLYPHGLSADERAAALAALTA